jgi:hypothetical protein
MTKARVALSLKALKGTGFSPYINRRSWLAFRHRGTFFDRNVRKSVPQGLKATSLAAFLYGLKAHTYPDKEFFRNL